MSKKVEIEESLYKKLCKLGIIGDSEERNHNVGTSDYSKHFIQPWSIWQDYNLNAFDADIVKRVLRNKGGESRILDYEKIIHICQERIRQLKDDDSEMEEDIDTLAQPLNLKTCDARPGDQFQLRNGSVVTLHSIDADIRVYNMTDGFRYGKYTWTGMLMDSPDIKLDIIKKL